MSPILKTLHVHAVVLGCASLLGACAPGTGDLERYVSEVKARRSAQIEPIPQIRPYQPFAYAPGERRDPFTPAAREVAHAPPGDARRPDPDRNREALEEFPLDALKLVGMLSYAGRSYAMVKAPDGVIHRVGRGNHLGQNFGTVTRVSETEVELKEIVADGFGGFNERTASLAAE